MYMHLFFECPFNTACWNFVGIHRNFELPCLDMVLQAARSDFGRSFFREILITACGPSGPQGTDSSSMPSPVLLSVGKKASRMKLAWQPCRRL